MGDGAVSRCPSSGRLSTHVDKDEQTQPQEQPQEPRSRPRVADIIAFEKHIFDLHIKVLKSGKLKKFPRSFPRRMAQLSRELAKTI